MTQTNSHIVINNTFLRFARIKISNFGSDIFLLPTHRDLLNELGPGARLDPEIRRAEFFATKIVTIQDLSGIIHF